MLDVQTTQLFSLNFTSPAAASTVAQTPVRGFGPFRDLWIYAELTGATGGTLDIYLQTTYDGGTTWVDYAHFPQLAAGAGVILRTWAVSARAQQTTLTTVGKGTSPALAANTIVGGMFGDQFRVVAVAGAATSAGAAQVIQLYAGS